MKTILSFRGRGASFCGLWLAVLTCVGVASCFNTPDPLKLKCSTKAGCPAGYVCTSDGKCEKGSGVGGSHDASIGGVGGGAHDGSVTDSSSGGSSDAANPDVPAALPNGSLCTSNDACTSTNCVDGVCCDKTCGGCKACSNALTGQDDGTCAPVASGADPHEACADETSTNECGNDGTCDGNGACRKVGSNHVCAKGSCSTDGTSYTPATTCDGKGACMTATSKSCGQYQCAADTGCLITCDPTATTSPCDKGTYCDATTKVCTAQKPNGQTASQALECISGVVADGVCCDKACAGCLACTATLNGQATNTTGQCLPVKAGGDDPHKTCTAVPPCGLDGKCDGAGACHYTALNTACAADSCTGSTLTTSACDSSHHCTASTSACPNSAVCASTTACKTGCTSSSDCASGSYCASGTCKPKLVDGGSCAADSECQNGHCISGICCATTCAVCNSCSTGTCNPADNGKSCGTGQFCNNGLCGACADGSSCTPDTNPCQSGKVSCSTGTAQCVANGTKTPGTSCGTSKVCDGSGSCVACTTGTACTTNACEIQSTGVSCSTGQSQCFVTGHKTVGTNCGSGVVCDGSGSCVACTTGTACTTNSCEIQSTGVSCSTGTSQCFATGHKSIGTSCGSGVVCDGSGSCVGCTTGTACTTNPCETQSTGVSCTTGQSQCFATGHKPQGSSCGGAGVVCNSSGSCVACTTGTACAGTNPCQTQTTAISCSSGASQCFVTGNQPANTPCSGGSCDGNGTCKTCSAAMVCGGCLAWDFESGSTSPWTLGTRNDGTGHLQLAAAAGRGNYSMSMQQSQFTDAASDLFVEVPLCSGASVTVPSAGYTFSVDVLFQSASYDFGDDGSGSSSACPAVILEGDSGTTFSHIIAQQCTPYARNIWYPMSWTFPGPSVSKVRLRFNPGTSWFGNILLDTISIK